jgi:hypothetical protein
MTAVFAREHSAVIDRRYKLDRGEVFKERRFPNRGEQLRE